MVVYPLIPRYFFSRIIPTAKRGYRIWIVAILISVVSLVSVATLGAKAFIIPFLILAPILSLRYPGFLLSSFFFSVPVAMFIFFKYYTIIGVALAGFIIALWVARKMVASEGEFHYSKFLLFYSAAYLAVCTISGMNEGLTKPESNTIIRLFVFFTFIYAMYDLYHPRQTLLILIGATLPLIYASYTLLREFTGVSGLISFLDLYRLKPAGIFPFSNALGNVLMAIVPFWIALAIWLHNRAYKLISFAIASFLSLAIIMTNSRAALLGFGILMISFFIWTKKIKHLILLTLIILLLILSVPIIRNVVFLGLRFERGTTSRDVIWSNAIQMYETSPILGIGPGNFQKTYEPYFETAYQFGFFKGVTNAHNFVINTMTELGLGGLILALILYVVPFRESRKALSNSRSHLDKAMVYAIYGTLISQLARSLFEGGGIIGGGRFYPDIQFWLPLVMILKFNELSRKTEGNLFFKKSH